MLVFRNISNSLASLIRPWREFAWWDETEKPLIGTKIYFAHPYAPWERGTNERTNGLIRRYFPKGQKFALLTSDDIARVVVAIEPPTAQDPPLTYARVKYLEGVAVRV